jgi:hypothetical protein
MLGIGLAQYQSPAALLRAAPCPKTPKAWLESSLPLQRLQVGGQGLDPEGIRRSLRASAGLRASLQRELVAAKLNLLVGVESSAVVLSVATADAWLKTQGKAAVWVGLLQDTLEAFNRGRYGVCR